MAIRFLSRIDTSIAAGVRFDPDVVYSSQQHYDCRTATRLAASLEIPQIIHLHYTIGPWLRRLVVKRLRTADHVVAVSDFIRRQAIDHGVAEERVTTIHNTIRPFQRPDDAVVDAFRRQQKIPTDAFVYGMVSRLDPSKGHMDALAAFDRLAADDGGVWLVIAGSGRHEAKIRSAARRSSAADRIVFLGQRRDVRVILGALDVFVHPAVADPCPLAVLEAMAAGLPIIAYADGGVPELVQDGDSGLLARRGDVVDLTGLIGLLRKDPDMAVSFGRGSGGAGSAPVRTGARRGDVRRARHVDRGDFQSMKPSIDRPAAPRHGRCGDGRAGDESHPLLPGEERIVARAAPSRRAELTAGRASRWSAAAARRLGAGDPRR